jgi:Family of unknown function (DUF5941)
MTTAAAHAVTPTERPSTLDVYRDDGPLARVIGAAGRALPVPGVVIVLAGLAPLLACLAVEGDGASDGLAAAAVAWMVLCGGLAGGRRDTSALRWVTPPALRVAEYAGLLWIASLDGRSALPAAFALLCVIAFRHYDLVYRMRHRGVTPPAWLNNAAAGWDGRLVVGLLLLVAGALPAGFYVLAIAFGVTFAAESAAGWVRWGQGQRQAVTYEDEEDEAG